MVCGKISSAFGEVGRKTKNSSKNYHCGFRGNEKLLGKGVVMKITLEIPSKYIVTGNTFIRMHWARRRKLQEEIDNIVYYKIRSNFKSPIPVWEKVAVKYTLISRRQADFDNYYGFIKPINDAIVKSGLVPDDSPQHLDLLKSAFAVGERKVIVDINKKGGN
jgi:Holliday junction resolvase RusA-like endonuclease